MEFKDLIIDFGKHMLRRIAKDFKSGKLTEELLEAKQKTQVERGEIEESWETECKIQELRQNRLERERQQQIEKQNKIRELSMQIMGHKKEGNYEEVKNLEKEIENIRKN